MGFDRFFDAFFFDFPFGVPFLPNLGQRTKRNTFDTFVFLAFSVQMVNRTLTDWEGEEGEGRKDFPPFAQNFCPQ